MLSKKNENTNKINYYNNKLNNKFEELKKKFMTREDL